MFVLLAGGALLVALRAHAWPAPLETDECNYIYIGQRIVEGDRLYVDVWDHQPPLMFAFMAASVRIVGASEFAYRSLATGVSLISLCLVYWIVRRNVQRAAAWLTVVLFALCSSDPGAAGEGGNRELFMNVLILGAFALIVKQEGDRWLPRLALAGLLLGLASAFKTVAAAHWLAMFVCIAVSAWPREKRPSRIAGHVSAFSTGPLLIWASIWVYFATTGRHEVFIDAVFAYNLGYSGVDASLWTRFGSFFGHWEIFRSAWVLWAAGGVGLIALPWRHNRRFAIGVCAMTMGSYVAVCLPGRFWPHYYYLMLPWLTICAGGVMGRLVERRAPRRTAWGYAVALVGLLAMSQAKHYLLVPSDRIASFRYKERMVWARDQGRRVGDITEPQDTVCVYGSDAGIYYYSRRRCATRFTMIEAVSAERVGVERRRRQFLEDFERNPPRAVLLTETPFPALYHLLQTRYVPVGEDPGRMQVLTDANRPISNIDWTWKPQ